MTQPLGFGLGDQGTKVPTELQVVIDPKHMLTNAPDGVDQDDGGRTPHAVRPRCGAGRDCSRSTDFWRPLTAIVVDCA